MPGQSGSWTDQEIKSLDADRLNFSHYSRVLAQVILEADTPLTVGVFGPWGCGKTSLMRLVEESLQEASTAQGKKVWTAWFNPWRYDRDEALWRALILRVLTVLRQKILGVKNADKPVEELPQRKQKVAQELEDLQASLYREVKREEIGGVTVDWEKMGRGAAGWVTRLSLGLIPGLGGPLSKVVEEAQKKLSGDDLDALFSAVQRQRRKIHRDQVRSLEQFRGDLEKLVETHVEKRKRRLVVFIDDLDRCLPEKAIEVLEAIKLFLDVPGCVFLIGADRDVIEEGIRVKYKSFLSGLGGGVSPDELTERLPITGDDYLEKIVQLPFHIPPLRVELVEEFIEEHEAGLPEGCAGIFCLGLEPNPRKVKRTLNIFRLLRLLAEERVRAGEMQGVEPQLLAKMVIILIRWRELFKDLQEYPNLLPELEEMWRRGETPRPAGERRAAKDPEEELAAAVKEPAVARRAREEEPLLERYGRIKALGKMLAQGPPWFADLPPEQLKEYIYLARSTTEAVEVAEVDIDERRWADLLSNDLTKIRAALADLDEAEKKACTKNLSTIVRSNNPPLERVSAGNALALLGDIRPGVDPGVTDLEQMEFCYVPQGAFQMGSPEDDSAAQLDEKPVHSMEIAYGYWIARYPVTVAQLRTFADAGHELGETDSLKGLPNHPAVWVSWDEGLAFCQWLTVLFQDSLPDGHVVRLPSEAQWEKAARGGVEVPARPEISSFADGLGLPGEVALIDNPQGQRRYPWGDRADSSRANYDSTGVGGTSAVGCFALGASPYGVEDLSGNVWEWTRSLQGEYPYVPDDGREDLRAEGPRVLRGGSFYRAQGFVRCAFRLTLNPDNPRSYVGFRVVVCPGSPE